MFDVSWSEILLIGAVSVVVIGPKDLPRALHTVGTVVRKIKTFSSDMQKSLDKIMQEAELEEITRVANQPGAENLQKNIEEELQAEERRKAAQQPVEKHDSTD